MGLYSGQLDQDYIARLETMTLEEAAAEAALYRSDYRRPGTATHLILWWICVNRTGSREQADSFRLLYCRVWEAEKAARSEGRSKRPDNRPAKGGRQRSHLTAHMSAEPTAASPRGLTPNASTGGPAR